MIADMVAAADGEWKTPKLAALKSFLIVESALR
jgi:hypothetical protein